MTRMRVWLLTALVAIALGFNFSLLTPRIAQSAEETVRGHLAAATNAVRTQIELRDARLNPRLAAESPDLIDSLRPPADPTLPVPKPDEKALRAAAAAAQPTEPDLLIVATADGAAWSRRGKSAVMTDDTKELPLVKAALDGTAGAPSFAQFDGSLFRVQAARIPGSVGVVVTGLLIDDHLASSLRAAADTDVTVFHDGQIVASSLPEDKRSDLISWARAPRLGYGVLPLHLIGVGNALDGKFPRWASRYAVRAAGVPLEGGVMIALTASAYPNFGWLARYQAYYALAFICFLLFGLIWGLLPGAKSEAAPAPRISTPPRPATLQLSDKVAEAASRAEATLAGANDPGLSGKPAEPRELPWTEGEAGWNNLGQSVRAPPPGPRPESIEVKPIARSEPAFTSELAPTPSAPAQELAPAVAEVKSEPSASDSAPAIAPAAVDSAPKEEAHPAPVESKATELAAAPAEPFASAQVSETHAHAVEPSQFTELDPSMPDVPAIPADPFSGAADLDPFASPTVPTPSASLDPFGDVAPTAQHTPELHAQDALDPFAAPSATEPATHVESAHSEPAHVEPAHSETHADTAAAPTADSPASTDEFAKHAASAFSFASMLDEVAAQPAPPSAPLPLLAQDESEETRPGLPSRELLAHSRDEDHSREDDDGTQFPGDEPTRIEAVSAALLDKLREKDDSDQQWGAPAGHVAANDSHEHEAEPEAHAADAHAQEPETHATDAYAQEPEAHGQEYAAPEPQAHADDAAHGSHEQQEPHEAPAHEAYEAHAEPATEHESAAIVEELPADALAPLEEPADPDEAHFQDTYRQFIEMRQHTGEPADKVSYEKFVAKLRKNREELLAKHAARGVRFSVYMKDGRAAIKASAIR